MQNSQLKKWILEVIIDIENHILNNATPIIKRNFDNIEAGLKIFSKATSSETERSLRDRIYSNLPNGHKGRTKLGRRCVYYVDDNDTHVVAKLHKLRKDQLFSLYQRLRNMGLLKDLPPISEVTA